MRQRVEARDKSDIFLPLSKRPQGGVYFLRLADYGGDVNDYVWRVHELARQKGAIIEGQITNPDERQLGYFNDILGADFRLDLSFILSALKKWMPRMNQGAQSEFGNALFGQLNEMKRLGKPEGVLKNVYIKMMCWLYYRFERVMPFLGGDEAPKLLYEGSSITAHELIFLRIINSIGVDILLLETRGDGAYIKVDPESRHSQRIAVPSPLPFPADYSLKTLRKQMAMAARPQPAQNPSVTPPRPANTQGPNPARSVNTAPPQPVAPAQRGVNFTHPQPGANQSNVGGSPSVQPSRGVNFTPPQPGANQSRGVNFTPPQPGANQSRGVSFTPPQPSTTQSRGVNFTPPQPNAAQSPSVPNGNQGSKYHIQFNRMAPAEAPRETGKLNIGTERPVPSPVGGAEFPASVVEKRFPAPNRTACTNAWMTKPELDQVLMPPVNRGNDIRFFYNAFIRLTGVKDRITYENEIFQFNQNLTSTGRKELIIDGEIPKPEPEEIDKIRRRSYRNPEELIVDLALNLPSCANSDLQRLMQRAFVRAMSLGAKEETSLNRLTVTAVYVLCWINRYQSNLFHGWKDTDVSVFIKMGGCESQAEALYLLFLSQLPVDVLILSPDLNNPCVLRSETLLDIRYDDTLPLMKFPRLNGSMQMRTVASHAQRDLRSLLFNDTGMYASRQFSRAEAITLQTTYDEIFILWDKELRFRPNFSTGSAGANIPVIFASISGVEKGKLLPYWQKIKLVKEQPDTLYIPQFPYISQGEAARFQSDAVKWIKNERIKKDEVKNSRSYPFGLLREEMQEHIFEKLQQMLDQRIIKGTFENGTEYTVLSTVLAMQKELLRLIQGFDFTKKNPKIVAVHTRDKSPGIEDAILLSFLNKIGFDIIIFVPTGYQTIERYLNGGFPIEHQIGDYVYDLTPPDFSTIPPAKGNSWFRSIFK